ncbi:transposase [Rhodococcus opacus PD630]|nr:transposase [Rhodococcus opacus PD630]
MKSRDAGKRDGRTDRLGPLRILSIRVAELCPIFLPPNPSSCTTSLAGDRQCDFRFPPITRPIDQGQIRTTTKLPILTMNCGCPRWVMCGASARGAVDLLADWWHLVKHPHILVAEPRRAWAKHHTLSDPDQVQATAASHWPSTVGTPRCRSGPEASTTPLDLLRTPEHQIGTYSGVELPHPRP